MLLGLFEAQVGRGLRSAKAFSQPLGCGQGAPEHLLAVGKVTAADEALAGVESDSSVLIIVYPCLYLQF